MTKVVDKVIFDCVHNGLEYKDIVLDFGQDKDNKIDQDYLFSEDGPWCDAELGDNVFDFQVSGKNTDYEDPDCRGDDCEPDYSPDNLYINGYPMFESEDGTWHHGEWKDEITITSNIRVIYKD